jgi:hypothetical protein
MTLLTIKSYRTAAQIAPQPCREIIQVCRDQYSCIAMDAFGINGATSKSDYVSVMADQLHWVMEPGQFTRSTPDSEREVSEKAQELYASLTHRARTELIGRAYQG